MSDMDWADLKANEILDGSESEALTIFSAESDRMKIAAALRKAKADGALEAIENAFEMWRTNTDEDFIAIMTRLRASAIEKGTE